MSHWSEPIFLNSTKAKGILSYFGTLRVCILRHWLSCSEMTILNHLNRGKIVLVTNVAYIWSREHLVLKEAHCATTL